MNATKTMTRSILLLSVLGLGLAACGNTKGDRALTGAGLGAGVGLLGGAVVGHPVAGAVVGGAAGAATGAVTDSSDVNFGKPIWQWDD